MGAFVRQPWRGRRSRILDYFTCEKVFFGHIGTLLVCAYQVNLVAVNQ